MQLPTVPKSHAGQQKFLISCAVQAPSSHNTQPWKFSIENNDILVWADLKRSLPIGDPHNRELYISVGASLQNIISGSKAIGCKSEVNYFPSPKTAPNLVARVTIIFPKSKSPKIDKQSLQNIWERRSNRSNYLPEKIISKKILQQITKIASDQKIHLNLIDNRKDISKIGEMVQKGMIEFLNKPEFRQELSGWIRHDWSKKGDGLPGYSIGLKGIMSILAPVLVKSTSTIPTIALAERKAVESCPVVGVLSMDKDTPLFWVKAGMVFEGIALTLHNLGIATSILTAAVESKTQNIKLRRLVKGIPVLFFRLGYATGEGISVPRRDGDDVAY